MEWLERFNQSMQHIEENLAGDIDYKKVAEIACCSVYHYQRMFSYIANVPLSVYIRRRRMSMSAFELQNCNSKVVDLALKYGYNSPTSFARAFQQIHGVSPSEAKKKGVLLKSYSPMTFKISIKGEKEMNYQIETKEAFRIVGVKDCMVFDAEENFKRVPQFWQETIESDMIPRISELMNQEPMGLLAVSTSPNGKDLEYYIACATDKPVIENTFEYEVPKGMWAIFECVGPLPQTMQDLQRKIVTEWLPSSGYEYANRPDIEVYSVGDQSSSDYHSQVWLPIDKKK